MVGKDAEQAVEDQMEYDGCAPRHHADGIRSNKPVIPNSLVTRIELVQFIGQSQFAVEMRPIVDVLEQIIVD